MMKLQENSKQLSFLIICFSQKPTFEVLSANLKTLTALFFSAVSNKGGSSEPNEPPLDPPLHKTHQSQVSHTSVTLITIIPHSNNHPQYTYASCTITHNTHMPAVLLACSFCSLCGPQPHI